MTICTIQTPMNRLEGSLVAANGVAVRHVEMTLEKLEKMQCVACRVGAPRLTDEAVRTLRVEVPDWIIIDNDGIRKLQRVFGFENFVQALAFTSQVGGMAEAEGHHPAVLTEWGKTTVTWWSMKIKGLHRNDFIAAAKTDALYRAFDAAVQAVPE